ncbi:MAG TPA: hypothetical protein VIT65_13825 [Microlunatus sp.]
MAGSWLHFVTKKGRFRGSALLENGGDVVEALEEAYGMVWYLADGWAYQQLPTDAAPDQLIEQARAHYQNGLRLSPGYTRAAEEQGIGREADWGPKR